MMQRIFALLFILTLAGNVLAGVCVCLDEKGGASRAKTSCCVRKKAVRASMKKKMCCSKPCGETGDNLPGSLTESAVKIPFIVRRAVERFIDSIAPRTVFAAQRFVSKRRQNLTAQFAKPLTLYLQHHAFLI